MKQYELTQEQLDTPIAHLEEYGCCQKCIESLENYGNAIRVGDLLYLHPSDIKKWPQCGGHACKCVATALKAWYWATSAVQAQPKSFP